MVETRGTIPSFWRSPSGQRFQGRYWRRRERPDHLPVWVRLVSLTAGCLLMVVGVALLVLPGPGFLFLGAGGALVAAESLTVARVLDWIEVDVRTLLRWVRRQWRRMRGT